MVENLRAVIFDLDDTLLDKSATLREIAAIQYSRFSLGTFGVAMADWEEHYVGLNNLRIEKSEVFKRLGEIYLFGNELRASLQSNFDKMFGSHVKPFPGAIDTIRACKKHLLKTGIITNGRDVFQRSKIEGAGITEEIDIVVTSGGVGIKKPDLRIFEMTLKALNVLPQEAAYVGDDFSADMVPAIKLGMCSIWKSDRTSPQVTFSSNDFGKIFAYILNRCAG